MQLKKAMLKIFDQCLHLRSIEEPRMTAETAAPCVQGMQGVQTAMAGQGTLQQVQDGKSTGGYYSSTSAVYDPEYARMEAWLDEHPDFVNDYFLSVVKQRSIQRRDLELLSEGIFSLSLYRRKYLLKFIPFIC